MTDHCFNSAFKMDEVTLLRHSYQLIRKDFGLEESWDFEDLNRLLNALYRIDIPENRVKDLLQHSKQGEIARNVAKAIIEREKQKVITRQQYQP